MSQQPDAIIIGTGVIGTAVAFEMAKNGWKTMSLDRNAQIGHGSTAGSCAIIRMHYSTFDGTAFAWEGYHYWRDWKAYLGLPDGHALAKFKECGCMVMRTKANGNLDKHLENSRETLLTKLVSSKAAKPKGMQKLAVRNVSGVGTRM